MAVPDALVFYSKSADVAPGKGKGAGWTEHVEEPPKYADLASIPQWRKKLSNMHVAPFELDGKVWSSVEHFFHAAKYRKHHPTYYATFASSGGKPWSTNPFKAKKAGKAGRVSKKGKVFRAQIDGVAVPVNVKMRPDFYAPEGGAPEASGVDRVAMKWALLAKFAQHADLKRLLLATGDAELFHLVTQRGKKSQLHHWSHLMGIRECIRANDGAVDVASVSAYCAKEVDVFLA